MQKSFHLLLYILQIAQGKKIAIMVINFNKTCILLKTRTFYTFYLKI